MRKVRELMKNKKESSVEQGPFHVLHHFRLISKSKRRSLLRKKRLAKQKNPQYPEIQSNTEPSQQNSTNLEEKQRSLWDVLAQFPKLQKERELENQAFLFENFILEEGYDPFLNDRRSKSQKISCTEFNAGDGIDFSFLEMQSIFESERCD